jgi:hypothetical protein
VGQQIIKALCARSDWTLPAQDPTPTGDSEEAWLTRMGGAPESSSRQPGQCRLESAAPCSRIRAPLDPAADSYKDGRCRGALSRRSLGRRGARTKDGGSGGDGAETGPLMHGMGPRRRGPHDSDDATIRTGLVRVSGLVWSRGPAPSHDQSLPTARPMRAACVANVRGQSPRFRPRMHHPAPPFAQTRRHVTMLPPRTAGARPPPPCALYPMPCAAESSRPPWPGSGPPLACRAPRSPPRGPHLPR